MIEEGDKLPEFTLLNQNGEEVSSDKFKGKYLVLYFYPKDNTPGCTTEACSFRDYNADIRAAGAEIVGVSKDSSESHKKFEEKHDLNFTLLADPTLKFHKEMGVIVEKSMFGKKYMGTQRSTFLVDPEGAVVKAWPKVSVKQHAMEVYNYLRSLVEQS